VNSTSVLRNIGGSNASVEGASKTGRFRAWRRPKTVQIVWIEEQPCRTASTEIMVEESQSLRDSG
jgi:hypothetical protein